MGQEPRGGTMHAAGAVDPVEAVVLDVDGTLVDSNDIHARTWVEAARELGFDMDFDDVRPLIGMGGDRVLRRLLGHDAEDAVARRLKAVRGRIFRQGYLPRVRALPGARRLVETLRDRGLRLVVASSAGEEDLTAMLRRVGLDDLLDRATSSSDADSSKPDPDILRAALDRVDCPAERAVMLGDTPYDVAAGRRLGLRVVALRSGGWGDADLEGAIAIYDDPADLLHRIDASPFCRPGDPGE